MPVLTVKCLPKNLQIKENMILRGLPVAQKIYDRLKEKIEELKQKNIKPHLAVILVGDDPASLKYVELKEKKAAELGVEFKFYHLPANVLTKNIEELINDLNKNKFIQGIIIQLPLPKEFATDNLLEKIDPKKDIDGLTSDYTAPTAAAILEILKFYQIELKDKKIVIVGRGKLVGKPLQKMLMAQTYEPLVCDSETQNLKEETLKADILILATGVPGLIKPGMVKNGAIVIDAGTSESNGKMVGDVDPEVYQKDISYTPNPGGVGPVTVACLMKNLIDSFEL